MKKTAKKSRKAIVTVTINGANKMTPEGKKMIARWLRNTGTALVREGDEYAERFTARYIPV